MEVRLYGKYKPSIAVLRTQYGQYSWKTVLSEGRSLRTPPWWSACVSCSRACRSRSRPTRLPPRPRCGSGWWWCDALGSARPPWRAGAAVLLRGRWPSWPCYCWSGCSRGPASCPAGPSRSPAGTAQGSSGPQDPEEHKITGSKYIVLTVNITLWTFTVEKKAFVSHISL